MLIPTRTAAVTKNDYGRVGKQSIAPNERITLWVPADVRSIASNGYMPSCNWTLSSNSSGYVRIVSRNTWSCTIEGVSASSMTFTLTFKGNSTIGSNVELWEFTGYYDIEVKNNTPIKVTEVKLNYTSASMVVRDTKQLSVTISPSNATDKSVTWSSSNETVAYVDGNGKVTAKAKGEASITCKANDGSGKQDKCYITVSSVKSWTLFTSKTAEGIEMKFISRNDGTCYVYASYSEPSIDINTKGKVTIPEEVEGLRVTSIANYAFMNCTGITEVIVPNSVDTIFYCAFKDCTALSKVSLGNGVKTLDSSVFYGCISLTTITGISQLESIGPEAFNVTYNTFIPWYNNLPDGLLYLGKVLYKYKGTMPDNTTVNVKEGITQIGYSALMSCNGLVGISIPQSLKCIDGNLAGYCQNLTSITVASGNERYDSRNNCNAIIDKTTNVMIQGCKNTTIPSTVTAIGRGAFSGSSITSVVIPNSIDSIAENAFIECRSLEEIVIGKGLRRIMDDAFRWCGNVKTVNIVSGNPYFDSRDNCNAIIEKPTNTLVIGFTTTKIPSSVKAIGNSAFYNNNYIESIDIPNGVEKIGQFAFSSCYGLRTLTLGKDVKGIGKGAFGSCPINRIVSKSSDPEDIDESVFSLSVYDDATLYVPVGSKINYMTANGWTRFKNIVEFDPSAVSGVSMDADNNQQIYDFNGRKLDSQHKGINIINGRKVIVK